MAKTGKKANAQILSSYFTSPNVLLELLLEFNTLKTGDKPINLDKIFTAAEKISDIMAKNAALSDCWIFSGRESDYFSMAQNVWYHLELLMSKGLEGLDETDLSERDKILWASKTVFGCYAHRYRRLRVETSFWLEKTFAFGIFSIASENLVIGSAKSLLKCLCDEADPDTVALEFERLSRGLLNLHLENQEYFTLKEDLATLENLRRCLDVVVNVLREWVAKQDSIFAKIAYECELKRIESLVKLIFA